MPLYALEKRLSLLVANYSVKAIEARNSTARAARAAGASGAG